MNRRLVILVGAILLFLAGWSFGRSLGFSGKTRFPAQKLGDTLAAVEAAPSRARSDLLARIQSAPAAELESFYKKFSGGGHEDLDSLLAFRALVRRSVLEDPDSMIKGTFTGNQIEEITIVWLEVDPAGFFAHLPLAENSLAQPMRRQAAFTAPHEFIKFAAEYSERPPEWNGDLATAILGIADSDPRAALALLDRLGLPDNTSAQRRDPLSERDRYVNSVQSEVASLLAAEDPATALAWARNLRSPETRQKTLINVVATWALNAPDAAAGALRELAGETGMSLHDLASRMSSLDPERTILFLDRFGGNDGPLQIREFGNQLRDPESIRRVHDQLGSGKTQQQFREELLRQWGDRSLEAGLDWALATPLEERKSALRAFGGNLGRGYSDHATDLAGKIDDPDLRAAFNDALRQTLSETDPRRAIALARASGDEEALTATIEWTAYLQSMRPEFSPREVFEWTRAADGGLRSDIYEELAQRYYRENPAEAEVWILSMEEGYDKAMAVFAAGSLSGWLVPFRPAPDLPLAETGGGVTFQGGSKGSIPPMDLLGQTPPGAKHSRADTLVRLEAANRAHDLPLQKILLSEWARDETAEGIRAVFAIGNRTEGWQLLRAWASYHPEEAVSLAVERPNDPEEAGSFDSVHYAALRQLLLTEPEKAIAMENRFHRRGRDRSIPELGLPGDPLPRPDDVLAALAQFRDPILRTEYVKLIGRMEATLFASAAGIDWIEENIPPTYANSRSRTLSLSGSPRISPERAPSFSRSSTDRSSPAISSEVF